MTTPKSLRAALVALPLLIALQCANAATLVPRDATWSYRKGDSAPSNPADAWRNVGFDDAAWPTGDAPFRYGDGSGGTTFDDMRGSYVTIFLRRTFNVPDASLVSRLDLTVDFDDGFAVWINGTYAYGENDPANPTHLTTADGSRESGNFVTFTLPNHGDYLVTGENTIAIQVFNTNLTSSDIFLNPEITSVAPDLDPPTVIAFTPATGDTLPGLEQATVTFSEPVTGVTAGDLLLNDTPAVSVSGSAETYAFNFAPGTFGSATLAWAPDHGIADTANPPNAFDHTPLSEIRNYTVVDQSPPIVTSLFPPAGTTVRSLTQITVAFSEPVTGIVAGSLLAGGNPATAISGSGAGPYTFTLPAIPDGDVTLAWADSHAITDNAADPNAFTGTPWAYTVDPDSPVGGVIINEIVASNRSGRTDQDGESSDWIELYNFSEDPIDLAGWSLSDDPDNPGKWVFPARTLAPDGHLLVFASGKNRTPANTGELHTNFKLSASGEFLGLFSAELPRAAVDQLSPEFPEQRADHAYGRDDAGAWRYLASPTPGSDNNAGSALSGLLPTPHANAARGFYDRAFNLTLTSPEFDATIRYTTDGSEPSPTNGTVYTTPVTINRTTTLRAASFRAGFLPSRTVTHTYLYNVPAAQRSLPVLSLVTDDSNLWGPTGIQETNPRNTTNRGIAWERPVSAELIRPEDNGGFQADCGLRVQGGNYVRGRYDPNAGLPFRKYSFRLYFRGDYGPSSLDYPMFGDSAVRSFEQISLRAGMNDHSNPFIVDELARRLFLDTGAVGSRGTFANLFINGEYKGYYNPTERIDEDFLRSWHGRDSEWDLIAQFGEVREGDRVAWDAMISTVTGNDMSVPTNYQAAGAVLDIDNFIDYIMVNIYGGTGDWPNNNWRAARERIPGAKYKFLIWDAEWAFGHQGRSVNTDNISSNLSGGAEIARIFQSLLNSPEFRSRFADRVQLHFFDGGALTDENVRRHYDEMRAELSAVIPNLNTYIPNTFIPGRRNIVFDQLMNNELMTAAPTPVFSQNGGGIDPGYQLTMTAPSGTVYYTTDGTDPLAPIDPDAGGFTRSIFTESVQKRALVPSTTNGGSTIGLTWTGGNEPFDDSSWTLGTGGMGYDEATTYQSHIQIDLDDDMNDINASAYMRIPFTVSAAQLEGVNWMQLSMKYDDGFVAYLNGVRIEDSNALASPVWNSEGNGQNDDTAAVQFRGFNVTDFLGELRVGQNILAIHGLNDSLGSSDFLCSPQLEVGMRVGGGVSDTAIETNGPVTLNPPARILARTLHNGEWSALVDATFDAGSPAVPLRFTEIMYNPPGGSAYEFIELTNTGARPFDLSFATFDGIGYTFAPGTSIPAGASFVLSSNDNPDAFAARYPGATVSGTFTGSLSNGGERIELLSVHGAVLASVRYRDDRGWPTSADGGGNSIVIVDADGDPHSPASWRASTAAGGSPGTTDPAPAPPSLRINEVLADSPTSPDFIELHNTTASAIDLSSYGITDNPGQPYRFIVPAGTTVPAGGYLVLWCDTDIAAPGLHTGFALDPDGETLLLHSPGGALLDVFTFGAQVAGHSLSFDGSTWQLTQPSPGTANTAPVPLAPQSALALNEWLTDPLPGDDDWLELFNTDTARPVALHGLHLSAGAATHRYPTLAFLAPASHLRLWADDLDLRLTAAGTTLTIDDATGTTIDSVDTIQRPEGVTAGRLPDGTASVTAFPDAASPGAANYTSSNPGLVLSELLTAPASWLELHNTTASTFDLTGYSLSVSARSPGQIPLSAPPSLAPGTHSTIPAPLPARGTTVYLFDPAGRQIDRLSYGPQIPDHSVSRIGSNWSLTPPTPSAPNAAATSLASTTGLKINEWLAGSGPGTDDFVELYNPAAQPVALTGLRLTDDLSAYGLTNYSLPPLSFIAADGFLHYIADGNLSGGPAHLPFSLNADGETLRLTTASRSVIDEVTWGIETTALSSGRLPDGDPSLTQLPIPTPGLSNTTDPLADSDGDLMPDAWEQANGLDPLNPADASTDLDADGNTNLDEYLANTAPRDPTSNFTITAATPAPGGLSVTFTAQPGITYTLESTTDLITWTRITTITPIDTPGSKTIVHDTATPNTFIRITATRTLD